MPLLKGTENIRKNIQELNSGKVDAPRLKAISTYARKHKISPKEARFRLSLQIAKSVALKK